MKSPVVEIEIGGEIAKTNVLKDIKKNPNFQDSRILYFDVVSNNISYTNLISFVLLVKHWRHCKKIVAHSQMFIAASLLKQKKDLILDYKSDSRL